MQYIKKNWERRIWGCLREFRLGLLLLWLGAFAGGILCARCRFLDTFTPAGLAWAAAWGTAGVGYVPACLGLLCVWAVQKQAEWILPLLLLSVLLLLRQNLAFLHTRRWTGYAALALCHALALLEKQLPLEALLDVWNLLLALAMYAAFDGSARMFAAGRPIRNGENALAFALSLGALLAGLPGGRQPVFDITGLIVMLTVLACARFFGAAGAGSAGLACGLALYLSGSADAAYVCIWGAAGLSAGALSKLGLLGPAAGLAMGEVTLSLLITGDPFSAIAWQAMAAGTFIYCLVPRKIWQNMREKWLLPKANAQLFAPADARQAAQRLSRFSQCFDELASAFEEGEKKEALPWEEAMPLLEQVAQETCVDCPQRSVCWKKEFSRTAADLMAAARVQEEERRILWEEDFPEGFAERCQRLPYVTEALRRVCGTMSLRRQMLEEVKRSRSLVGRQMRGMSRIMEQLSRELSRTPVQEGDHAGAVRTKLKAMGMAVRGVHVARDASGRFRAQIVMEACAGGQVCVGEILPVLHQVLGCPMQWQPCACPGVGQKCRLHFTQARLMTVSSSALQWAAGGECGDACIRMSLGDRGYLLAISDGMGTGDAAARESRRLLKLVEEFYRAGFEEDVIFSTVNEMLLLRPGCETFATLDICLVDLLRGKAHFVKLGAAPSYLIREDRSIPIEGSSLPVGIVEEMRPMGRSLDLLPGDVIVMGSDGIVTADEHFPQRLTQIGHWPPERMARTLMQEADERQDLRVDDRTLIVARIQASHRDRAEEFKNRRMLRWKARVS